MKSLIHDITTGIKFLYPCSTHGEETIEGQEILVTAETKLSRLYPVKLRVDGMVTLGDDFWGRCIFKDNRNQYYCDLDGLLYFKGNDPEGEPHYPVDKEIHYDYPTIDDELSEVEICVSKVKEYIQNKTSLKLVEVTKSIQRNSDTPDKDIVICHYRLRL